MTTITIVAAKIKTSFTNFTNAVLYAFASAVFTRLNGNADFPETQALLPDLNTAVVAFNVAMDNAEGLGKVLVQIRNNKRIALIYQLSQVSDAVIFEAKGDREKLLGSGFEMQKTPEASIMVKPASVEVTDGNNQGELKQTAKGGKSIKTIVHQITDDPITTLSVWTSEASTSREYTFKNLQSQKKYWCRILSIGSQEQEFYSDPISRVAQ